MGSRKRRPVRDTSSAQSPAADVRGSPDLDPASDAKNESDSLSLRHELTPVIDPLSGEPWQHEGALLRQVIQQAETGMGLLQSSEGRVITANPALCRLLGRSEPELQHCDWRVLLSETGRPADSSVLERSMALQRPDQSWIWLHYSIRALPAESTNSKLLLLQAEDISEQHQAQALARQEHELLHILLTHIDAMIDIKDRQGRYLYANPAALKSLGCSALEADSILGRTDFDLLPQEIAEQRWQFEREALAHGGPLRREERLPGADGREAIFLAEKLVCGQQEDGAGYLLGFATDITDLRQATEQLAVSEQRFRLLAENSGEVILQLDSAGTIRWVSLSLTPTLGWQPEEWIDRLGTEFLVHRGETEQYQGNLEQVKQGTPLVIARDQVLARDGTVHWVETAASPFINAAGAADGCVARLRLVDDQVEAETRLRRSEESYRLLAENARDVIWTMAADGEISYVSPSVQWLRGISPEQAMVQPLEQVHPPESRRRVLRYLRQVDRDCRGGRKPQSFRDELAYFCADGSTIWCDVLALPVLDEDGSLRYLLGTSRDITERKRYEQELNLTNQQLSTLASTDSLTVVCNRHRLQLTIQQLLSSSAVSGEPVAMILCDIDHFKAVNDSHGHSVGDQVLVEFSRRLQCCLRGSDRLGRWGGEEFLILVP